MRKRVRILVASTMTVVGLTAGVTPAHATNKPEGQAGTAYSEVKYLGYFLPLDIVSGCNEIPLPEPGLRARSATNAGKTQFTITLYASSDCKHEVAVLKPDESDNGYVLGSSVLSELGVFGATHYATRLGS